MGGRSFVVCGHILGLCGPTLGAMLPQLEVRWAMLAHLGGYVAPSWAMFAHLEAYVGPC